MSSRRDPSEVLERILSCASCPELIVEVCLARGIPVKLHKPDLQSKSVELLITASRDDFMPARREWLGRMYVGGPEEYEKSLTTLRANGLLR